MNAPEHPPIRLTQFSHGGGCGCKIAPGVLRQILDNAPHLPVPAALLVGIETSDDAAVYRLNDRQAIVATTDFFTPVVDDPFDFGAIAAANALSDVYAMGGTPLFALAIVGMPVATLPLEAIRRILDGGQSICAKAGIPVAGGHTIDTVEPIYGLVAIGVVDPERLKRNADARDGDVIILGKPLGIGIYSAALKRGALADDAYRAMLDSTTQLNTPGMALAAMPGVHALTDVTGFGLVRTPARNVPGRQCRRRHRIPAVAAASRRAGSRARRLRHRRVGPELGRLRQGGHAGTGDRKRGTRAADRPSDLRRPARRLRA